MSYAKCGVFVLQIVERGVKAVDARAHGTELFYSHCGRAAVAVSSRLQILHLKLKKTRIIKHNKIIRELQKKNTEPQYKFDLLFSVDSKGRITSSQTQGHETVIQATTAKIKCIPLCNLKRIFYFQLRFEHSNSIII